MNPYEIALLQLQQQNSPADYKGTMQPAHWRKEPNQMNRAMALAFQQYDPSNAQAQRQIGSRSVGVLLPNNPYRKEAEQAALENVQQAMTDPMVVGAIKPIYHGTDKAFKKFNTDTVWFTDSLDQIKSGEAGAAGEGRIIKRYLDDEKLKLGGWDESDKYMIDELRQMGYDGLALPDDGVTTYQIFNPEKLSSKR